MGFQLPQSLAGASPQLKTLNGSVGASSGITHDSFAGGFSSPWRIWGVWLTGYLVGTPSAPVACEFDLQDSVANVYLQLVFGLTAAGVVHDSLSIVLPGGLTLAGSTVVTLTCDGIGAVTGVVGNANAGIYYSVP